MRWGPNPARGLDTTATTYRHRFGTLDTQGPPLSARIDATSANAIEQIINPIDAPTATMPIARFAGAITRNLVDTLELNPQTDRPDAFGYKA